MDALHETALSCALCFAFGVNRRMKLFSTAGRKGVCTWLLLSRVACIVKSPAHNTPLPLIRPNPYLRQNLHSRRPVLRCCRLTPLLTTLVGMTIDRTPFDLGIPIVHGIKHQAVVGCGFELRDFSPFHVDGARRKYPGAGAVRQDWHGGHGCCSCREHHRDRRR